MERAPATHADLDRHFSTDPPILSLQTEPATIEYAHPERVDGPMQPCRNGFD